MKKLGFSQQLLNKREIFNEGRGADERAIYCKLKMYTSFNAKHMQIFLFFPPLLCFPLSNPLYVKQT